MTCTIPLRTIGLAIVIVLMGVTLEAPPSLAESDRGATAATSTPSSPLVKHHGASLRLAEAIRIGLEQHPSIERSSYAAQLANALVKQAQGQRYPWLEASVAEGSGSFRIVTTDGKTVHDAGGHGYDPGGALAKHNQNMLTGGLILNQLISDFGHTAHRILASEAAHAATKKEILTQKAYVILSVQKAYLNCLLQQNLVDIAAATVLRRTAIYDQVRSLYKSQLKSKVDLDLVLVEVSNAELALIRARNDLRQAFAALNNAMGVEGPERYDLEMIPIVIAPAPAPESLVETGLKDRPELLGGRDRIVASAELLEAARTLNFGSLTAVGTIGITKYGDVHDGGIPDNGLAPLWGVGATMKFPLFTGFRIRNQIKEAGHRKGESEQELESIANEVVLQIVRAYLALTTNAEQIGLEQDRVAFSRDALKLAQERYRIGLSPVVEVVRATSALFEAESRLTEARYIYKTSEAAVAYATGQDYKHY